MTEHQAKIVIRAALLMGGYSDVLSDFEREVTDEVVQRFRKRGSAALITENEWRVVEESVGALAAVREARTAA